MPERPGQPDFVNDFNRLDERVRMLERHRHPLEETPKQELSLPLPQHISAVRRSSDPTQALPDSTPTTATFVTATLFGPEFDWDAGAPSVLKYLGEPAFLFVNAFAFVTTSTPSTGNVTFTIRIEKVSGSALVDQEILNWEDRNQFLSVTQVALFEPGDEVRLVVTQVAGGGDYVIDASRLLLHKQLPGIPPMVTK